MPAPVSIVIPTLNAQDTVGDTIACLFEGLSAGVIQELIISDGGSQDDIETIADSIGATFVQGEPGRGKQLARGAEAASAPWILFLHADTTLSEGWSKHVKDHIQTHTDAGYCALAFGTGGIMAKITSAGANLRARLFGLPYGDQGLLISRKMYAQVGGYRDIPLMEDVAMARAVRRQLRRLPVTATTSADRYVQQGWARRSFKNITLLMRFLLGADPQTLARAYTRND